MLSQANQAAIRAFVLGIAGWCILAFGSDAARGASMTLNPTKDGTIFQNTPNNSAGGQNQFFSGTNTGVSPRRALVSFDVSLLPPGITITDVTLTMRLSMVAGGGMGMGGGTPNIGLHELLKDWGEGDRTAGSGQGDAALNGDATWNNAKQGTVAWSTPGGDFDSSASASLTIVGTTTGVDYTWLSTAALVSDVTGWYTNPSTNFGWLLLNTNESVAQTFRAFNSREADTAGSSADDNFDPRLTITFVPEPTSYWLLVLGGVVVLAHRRSRRETASR